MDDGRFSKYARRYTHLLKLCLIHTVLEEEWKLQKMIALRVTHTHAAERMPKALGEFGKSKYSNVSNMIIEHLAHAHKPVTMTELWKLVAKDLSKVAELGDIMKNLTHSEKVQVVTLKDKQGYLLKHQESKSWASRLIDELFDNRRKVGYIKCLKRPDHPDFMDSSELRKMEFSGVRHNSIGNCMEIWILGEVTDSVSDTEIKFNPKAFTTVYENRFNLHEVKEMRNEQRKQHNTTRIPRGCPSYCKGYGFPATESHSCCIRNNK
jgi:hypothetical protein